MRDGAIGLLYVLGILAACAVLAILWWRGRQSLQTRRSPQLDDTESQVLRLRENARPVVKPETSGSQAGVPLPSPTDEEPHVDSKLARIRGFGEPPTDTWQAPEPESALTGCLWAWGANECGQLGDGSEDSRGLPVAISGIGKLTQALAGYRSALAVDTAGDVWAWGENVYGKLGDGTEENRKTPVRLASLSRIKMVAAGARTSYALGDDGNVWSWGGNAFHELGSGPGNDHISPSSQSDCWVIQPLSQVELGRSTPGLVHGLSRVVAIAAGGSRAFALRSDGTVWAWGDNQSGRLGDGTTFEHLAPTRLEALSAVTAIATGERSAYALRDDGTVWAWGDNSSGQLGDGSLTSRRTPVKVHGLYNVAAIAACWSSAYALKSDGSVWAWGDNGHGQLGDGTQIDRALPVPVVGISEATGVAAGLNVAYAILASGEVLAWGGNEAGQLPGFDQLDSPVPVQLAGFRGVISISARRDTVYALTDCNRKDAGWTTPERITDGQKNAVKTPPGSVWSWGSNNVGQLGDGSRSETGGPVLVAGLDGVMQVALDRWSGFDEDGLIRALRSDGTVWAWGGVYMNGRVQGLRLPTKVEGIPPISALADFFAVGRDGVVWDLRASKFDTDPRPKPVRGVTGAAAVYPFRPLLYSVGTDQLLRVYEKSHNAWEGTGDYYWSDPGRQLEGPVGVTSMASWWQGDDRFDIALTRDGGVWQWEVHNLGTTFPNQGEAEFEVTAPPALVPGLEGVKSIASGVSCGYALKADGTVRAWGDNKSGQLGNGTTDSSSAPMKVEGLENIVAIDPEGDSCLALTDSGEVWAWGANVHGELGDAIRAFSTTPVRLEGLDGVRALRGGFAIKEDGTVWGWGRSEHGRLADDVGGDRPTPRALVGPIDVVEVIHAPRPGYGESWFGLTMGPDVN